MVLAQDQVRVMVAPLMEDPAETGALMIVARVIAAEAVVTVVLPKETTVAHLVAMVVLHKEAMAALCRAVAVPV